MSKKKLKSRSVTKDVVTKSSRSISKRIYIPPKLRDQVTTVKTKSGTTRLSTK